MIVVLQSPRKTKITRMTSRIAEPTVKMHVANGFADGVGGVEGDLIFHAGRKALGKPIKFGDAALMNVQGVGGGELGDSDANRIAPVVIEVSG